MGVSAALDNRSSNSAGSRWNNGSETMTYQSAHLAKAAATYNAAADHFDHAPLSFWDRYGRRTVERLNLAPGAAVLDVGCGSGASALPAAEQVGPTGSVTGVDVAGGLLAAARTKAANRGLSNVEFREADMGDLRYPDAQFDAVVCVFAIFFVPDMERQVAELWRMVRPGGQLAITTWGPRMLEPGSEAFWSAVATERPDLRATFNPWERISEPAQVKQLFEDAGIAEASAVPETGCQKLAMPEDWWTIVLGAGFRWTVDQLNRDAAERVRAANIARLRRDGVRAVETNVIYAAATKPKD